MIPYFELEMDHDANAAYIRLSDDAVDRTIEVTNSVLVDLNSLNVVVGVEVLSLNAEIPFGLLRDQFHIHSDVIAQMQMVQPTVASFATFSTGVDGVSGKQQQATITRTLVSH